MSTLFLADFALSMPDVKGNNKMDIELLARVAPPMVMAAGGFGYVVISQWPKFKVWRAWRKVRREYGPVVADRFSAEQIMALAKYNGPKPPAVVEPHEKTWNGTHFAPRSEAEASDLLQSMVHKAAMDRLVDNPAAVPGVELAPKFADGKEVAYFNRRRKPPTLPAEYYETLRINQAQIEAVLRNALPDARPALTWEKPDHMQLTPDPYDYDDALEAPQETLRITNRTLDDLEKERDEAFRCYMQSQTGSQAAAYWEKAVHDLDLLIEAKRNGMA